MEIYKTVDLYIGCPQNIEIWDEYGLVSIWIE